MKRRDDGGIKALPLLLGEFLKLESTRAYCRDFLGVLEPCVVDKTIVGGRDILALTRLCSPESSALDFLPWGVPFKRRGAADSPIAAQALTSVTCTHQLEPAIL